MLRMSPCLGLSPGRRERKKNANAITATRHKTHSHTQTEQPQDNDPTETKKEDVGNKAKEDFPTAPPIAQKDSVH